MFILKIPYKKGRQSADRSRFSEYISGPTSALCTTVELDYTRDLKPLRGHLPDVCPQAVSTDATDGVYAVKVTLKTRKKFVSLSLRDLDDYLLLWS